MTAESNSEVQSGYIQAPELNGPVILDVPSPTGDLKQALYDLNSHGCCILRDALKSNIVDALKQQLDQQYAAEQALGENERQGRSGGLLHPLVDQLHDERRSVFLRRNKWPTKRGWWDARCGGASPEEIRGRGRWEKILWKHT